MIPYEAVLTPFSIGGGGVVISPVSEFAVDNLSAWCADGNCYFLNRIERGFGKAGNRCELLLRRMKP